MEKEQSYKDLFDNEELRPLTDEVEGSDLGKDLDIFLRRNPFEDVLDEDEDIVWIDEPSKTPFFSTGVPLLIFGTIWFCFDYFGFIRHMSFDNLSIPTVLFFLLHLTPFWLAIINMLRLFLVHKNTFYAFTDKRVLMRSGFWGTNFKSIDLDKISNIQVTVGPLEKYFHVGTIRLHSGRTTSKGAPISDNLIAIDNPYEVFNPQNSQYSYYKAKLPTIIGSAHKLFTSKMGYHLIRKNLLRFPILLTSRLFMTKSREYCRLSLLSKPQASNN